MWIPCRWGCRSLWFARKCIWNSFPRVGGIIVKQNDSDLAIFRYKNQVLWLYWIPIMSALLRRITYLRACYTTEAPSTEAQGYWHLKTWNLTTSNTFVDNTQPWITPKFINNILITTNNEAIHLYHELSWLRLIEWYVPVVTASMGPSMLARYQDDGHALVALEGSLGEGREKLGLLPWPHSIINFETAISKDIWSSGNHPNRKDQRIVSCPSSIYNRFFPSQLIWSFKMSGAGYDAVVDIDDEVCY